MQSSKKKKKTTRFRGKIYNYNQKSIQPNAGTDLTAESIKSPPLPLQRINHIHGSHRLPSSVLSVSHCITNHILQEDLQNPSSLLVDQSTDPLHTTSTSQTANCRLGDSLNVIPQDLPVTLGTSFTQTLTT
ncbi:Histone H4, partial [Quillaja saponaria]